MLTNNYQNKQFFVSYEFYFFLNKKIYSIQKSVIYNGDPRSNQTKGQKDQKLET
jgi:hypothetical protein